MAATKRRVDPLQQRHARPSVNTVGSRGDCFDAPLQAVDHLSASIFDAGRDGDLSNVVEDAGQGRRLQIHDAWLAR